MIRAAIIGDAPRAPAIAGVARFPLPVSTRTGLSGSALTRLRRAASWMLVPKPLLLAETLTLVGPPKLVRRRVGRLRQQAGLQQAVTISEEVRVLQRSTHDSAPVSNG